MKVSDMKGSKIDENLEGQPLSSADQVLLLFKILNQEMCKKWSMVTRREYDELTDSIWLRRFTKRSCEEAKALYP